MMVGLFIKDVSNVKGVMNTLERSIFKRITCFIIRSVFLKKLLGPVLAVGK